VKSIRKSQYSLAFPVKDKWLLLHGLSGAVKLVDKETAQKFFDGELTDELTPFFTYLTPEKEHEKATALCAFLMKKATACADGTLAVTYDCNLRCPYCYEIWAKHPETMKSVVNEYKVDREENPS
jgi:sulfatase maturation enzyme AslB (radical SAM superfamily)